MLCQQKNTKRYICSLKVNRVLVITLGVKFLLCQMVMKLVLVLEKSLINVALILSLIVYYLSIICFIGQEPINMAILQIVS